MGLLALGASVIVLRLPCHSGKIRGRDFKLVEREARAILLLISYRLLKAVLYLKLNPSESRVEEEKEAAPPHSCVVDVSSSAPKRPVRNRKTAPPVSSAVQCLTHIQRASASGTMFMAVLVYV